MYIYKHFTFEQAKFKRDFVIGNQKGRLKATSLVEKSFYKLLNNSNFGNDCRNNINNCILELLYDDLNETSYIKKFTTIFDDDTFRYFFHPSTFGKKLFKIDWGK